MAITEVDLCNLALSRIRGNEISDLLENSVEAEKCRVFYPEARDTVLSQVNWPFAKKITALALSSTEPTEYKYEYGYPIDCLNALYILPDNLKKSTYPQSMLGNTESPQIHYEIIVGSDGGRAIVTDTADAYLAYTCKVTDVRLFGPLCSEAISWKLAMDLAIPIGGDAGIKYRDDAAAAYQQSLWIAMAQNRNQSLPTLRQRLPKSIQIRSSTVVDNTRS